MLTPLYINTVITYELHICYKTTKVKRGVGLSIEKKFLNRTAAFMGMFLFSQGTGTTLVCSMQIPCVSSIRGKTGQQYTGFNSTSVIFLSNLCVHTHVHSIYHNTCLVDAAMLDRVGTIFSVGCLWGAVCVVCGEQCVCCLWGAVCVLSVGSSVCAVCGEQCVCCLWGAVCVLSVGSSVCAVCGE